MDFDYSKNTAPTRQGASYVNAALYDGRKKGEEPFKPFRSEEWSEDPTAVIDAHPGEFAYSMRHWPTRGDVVHVSTTFDGIACLPDDAEAQRLSRLSRVRTAEEEREMTKCIARFKDALHIVGLVYYPTRYIHDVGLTLQRFGVGQVLNTGEKKIEYGQTLVLALPTGAHPPAPKLSMDVPLPHRFITEGMSSVERIEELYNVVNISVAIFGSNLQAWWLHSFIRPRNPNLQVGFLLSNIGTVGRNPDDFLRKKLLSQNHDIMDLRDAVIAAIGVVPGVNMVDMGAALLDAVLAAMITDADVVQDVSAAVVPQTNLVAFVAAVGAAAADAADAADAGNGILMKIAVAIAIATATVHVPVRDRDLAVAVEAVVAAAMALAVADPVLQAMTNGVAGVVTATAEWADAAVKQHLIMELYETKHIGSLYKAARDDAWHSSTLLQNVYAPLTGKSLIEGIVVHNDAIERGAGGRYRDDIKVPRHGINFPNLTGADLGRKIQDLVDAINVWIRRDYDADDLLATILGVCVADPRVASAEEIGHVAEKVTELVIEKLFELCSVPLRQFLLERHVLDRRWIRGEVGTVLSTALSGQLFDVLLTV